MRLVGMTNFRNSLLAGVAMTAAERRAGRYMRAPDHSAGTGGGDAGGDAGATAGADTGASAATGGDAGASNEEVNETALGGAGKKADDPDAGGGAGEGDGAKEGEQAPAHVVPEAYELTPPDGLTIDADLLANATPIFKEAGLSNDQAQAILPAAKSLMEKTQQATLQTLIDDGNQQRKAWLDAAKADEQIGGAKWDASLASSAKALDALGHPEGSTFRTDLNETGFGNHPEMIRIFARIGEMVGEDGDFVRPDAGAPVDEPAWKRLYPND